MNSLPQSPHRSARRQPQMLGLVSFLAALAATHPLSATSLYWDPLGSAANSGTTATGAWDGTGTVWNTDSTGGAGGSVQAVTLSTDDLFFSSGTGFTGSSTVTFSGAVTANSITFEEGTITLAGTSTPSLTLGAGGLTFNNGTGANIISGPVVLGANTTFTNNDNSAQTLSGGLSGAFNLNINATSTGGITLSGASAGYSGTTTLTAGTLTATGAANNTFTALGTGGLVLNGGTLQVRSNGASNGGQTIVAGNNVTVGNTAVTVDVNNNGSNTNNNITFGNLSIGTGQMNVTGGNTYVLRFSGGTTLTGNAVFNPTTAGLTLVGAIGDGGNNFGITKIGTGTLTLAGSSTYTGTTSVLGGTLSLTAAAPSGSAGTLGNATSEILVGDTSGSVATSLITSLNSGTGIARNIRLQSGNSGLVTLNANANGSGTGTISGTITLGSDNGTGHAVTLASGSGGNAQFATANYAGVIQDATGLVGPGGLVTISGPGTTILGGANTFSGGVNLNGSTLILNNSSALGSGTLTITGGALSNSTANAATVYNNAQIWNGNFSFTSNNLTGFGSALTMSGAVSLTGTRTVSINILGLVENGIISDGGNGYGVIYKGGTGGGNSLTLGGANTFGGGVTIVGSSSQSTTLQANNSSALGSGQATITNSANSKLSLLNNLTVDSLTSGINTPTFTAGSGMTNGTYALVFSGGGGSGAAGTATVSGNAITAVSITSYGKDYTSAPTISITGAGGTGSIANSFGSSSINLNPGTARTLTISGTNASPATYAGIISGTNGNLIKTGAGTQTLTGINTYTGSTTVSGGKLEIAGGGSIGSTSGVTINGGEFAYNTTTALFKTVTLTSGVLSGTGTFTGSITVNGGLVTSTGTAGDVTVNAGGAINPGNTGVAGAFAADTLTWNSNDVLSGLRFDLGADNASSDSIAITGAFTKGSGSIFAFNFTDIGATASFTYTLLTFDSTDFSAGDFSATGVAGTFGMDANSLTFTVSAIPEPSASAALLGALVLTGAVWRRRRIQVG